MKSQREMESEVGARAWAGRAGHPWATRPEHCTFYADAALAAWRERFGDGTDFSEKAEREREH